MSGIFGAIAGAFERKASDISALTMSSLLGEDNRGKAGVTVTPETSLKVTAVLACARVLANGVSQVPLKVYREDADGGKKLAKDHPVYKILWRRPNEWMTSFDFRQVMMLHLVLCGQAFAYIGWAGIGKKRRVMELIPLTGDVEIIQDANWGVAYRVTGSDKISKVYRREQILHLRAMSWDGVTGLSPVRLAREAIGLSIATEETHSRLHSNGAKPGGLLSFEKALSDSARKRLRDQVDNTITGLNNAYKTMILDAGAKWTPFTMTGVDGEHLATRNFQVVEVCRAMGVFPQMIGHADKTATFASAESFFQAHVTHSLEPWYENWQQAIARDLFPDEDDLSAEFSVQGLLRGDHKSRAEFYASGITNGWMTRNDARARENLNPLTGLDEPLIPLNMSTQKGPNDVPPQA